ncbi:TetR/AcrR family transcriptional regulator [Actinoplanes sp. NEAU-A12]|uniref:TetR/AcrR family transcriptional regulator n=1 Tax=Actinoplanes sandaracinus TaxID=3045177 RepID=A0ABT6WUC7_9ACTN|nr:TetR/AcrR family transcriptional regulator [Actinoplanes sandaracinus]MDI6103333.1 TetR/AcrR family transcriptional regulator [Actinoplanes sandaracinus]
MPPQPARRSERSRRAILAATQELLTESGYAGLTIESIAARAGVGKQTIYRWWRGKGAVVLEAIAEHLPEATALPDTGDLRADLRGVVRATVAEFADTGASAVTRTLTVEILVDDELAGEVRDRLLRPRLEGVRARLEAARAAGQVRADAPLDQVVELVFGPVYHRWLLRTSPFTESYADALAKLVMTAVTPAGR